MKLLMTENAHLEHTGWRIATIVGALKQVCGKNICKELILMQICTQLGLAACTLKGCIPADASSARNAPKPADKSNLKVFTEAEFSDESFKCQPGENFMVDCNMCRCADGKQARCTKKRCVPGEV